MKLMKLVIASSVALALSACSDNDTAESHLLKAKNYITSQQVNESIIELKNALRLEPKNAEVRFILGQMYLSQGRGADAVKELERAHTLKYAPEKVIPLLSRAYILTESDEDVIELDIATTNFPPELKSQYLAYKTLASLRAEKPELALDAVEIVKTLPANLYGFLAQAYLAFSNQEIEEAAALVKKALASNAKQPDALMLQGQVSIAGENFALASKSFEEYLAVQPYSGIAQLLLADALLKEGKVEEAEKHADDIIAKIPSQPFANYIKATARFSKDDYIKASEHAEVALQSNFQQLQLKLIAGASAFKLQNFEQAHNHLSSVVPYLPADHVARRMLAVSQLQLGLVDEIPETLNNYQTNSAEDEKFLTSLSVQLFELGAVSQAKEVMAQSSSDLEPSAEQTARDGVLKLMMNDPSGIADLQQAVKLNPELIEAELALAFAAVQTGDLVQAKEIAEKWQKNYPDKPGSFNLLAAVAIKEQKFADAKALFEKSLALDSENFFAATEMVKVEVLLKDVEKANQLSADLVKKHPNNLKVLRQYFELNQDDKGLSVLKTAYESPESDVKHLLLYVEALASQDKLKEALTLLESYPVDLKTPKKYWLLSYGLNKNLNQNDAAQTVVENWRKNSPYHIEPIILLADILSQKREYSRAIAVINSGIEKQGDKAVFNIIKVNILLNNQDVDEAKRVFNSISKDELNEIMVSGITGRINLIEKDYSSAVSNLAVFYQARPSHQNALYYAAALKGDDQIKQAKDTLEAHLLKYRGNDRVRSFLATLYLTGEQNKALVTYLEIHKNQPENPIINNNLAWLFMNDGQLDKAAFHIEKAYKVAPELASVADTYSTILLKEGKKRQALEKAEQAYTLSKGKDVDIILNYSEILIANSRKNEAKKILDAIITETNEQKNKKEQLINKL